VSPPAASDLTTVRILGLPLGVLERASEHNDELLREFALVREENSDHVPSRLLALIEELNGRFGSFTEGPANAIQEALHRGDKALDLAYQVPADAGDAAVRLAALLDEADEFCRSGDLLTLATLPESLHFRRWFLEEFSRQIAGAPARSWAAFLEGAAPDGTAIEGAAAGGAAMDTAPPG
jgi:hypothetical protein